MNHAVANLIFFVILYLVCPECYGRQKISRLPSYFPQCYRNDPDLNKCLVDATAKVQPYLAKGIPELKIPPFEPFTIPEIALEQGTRALNFKALLKNVVVHGLTNYKFSQFDFDVPNMQFFCKAKIPGLTMEGDYTVTGRVFIAPIEGSGKFTAKIDDCDCFVYQKYKQIDTNGKIYLQPTLTNTSIQVSGPKAHLNGLFDGNEELNAATNQAINENVDELFEELKPVVEQTISKIMEDILLKTITQNIPYDDLYPVKP